MDQNFSCSECGKCCKNLLTVDQGILRGLSLLPEEVGNFPGSSVMPAIGIGTSPSEKCFRILVYQIISDTCPNLNGANCTIYHERPTSCKQYPFSLSIDDKSNNLLIGYDLNCPSLKKKFLTEFDENHYQEIEHAKKFLKVRLSMMLEKDRIWFFDLRDKLWKQKTD